MLFSCEGRWKSLASVRRYQKGARLGQIFAALPPRVQRLAKQSGRRYQPYSAKPALSSVWRPGPRYQVFLEIFSGCGRLGKAISRDNNWPVLLWDICMGERYDLRSQQNRMLILGWIRSRIHLGRALRYTMQQFFQG